MKILFAFCLFMQTLWAIESQQSIAISDLSARGMTVDEAAIISDRLRDEILATGKFRVMERSMMDEILKEQALQQNGACNTSECQVQMGRLLGVDKLVVGSTGKLGNLYSVSVRLLNVETGEIELSLTEDHAGAIEGLVSGPLKILAAKLAGKAVPYLPAAATPPPQALNGPRVITTPQQVATPGSYTLAPAPRGFPGTDLTWHLKLSETQLVPIDITNSAFAGLSLKPTASEPVMWFNPTNGYSYDKITAKEYEAFDQTARKAVLFGRLLHFGSYFTSEIINVDTSFIRRAVAADVLIELDVAKVARLRESRKSSGLIWGTIGMVIGFYTAYFGLLNTDCSNTDYSGDPCTVEPNMGMVSAGTAIMLASGAYMIFKLASPSSEEKEAAERVKAAVGKLQQ